MTTQISTSLRACQSTKAEENGELECWEPGGSPCFLSVLPD